MAMELLARLMRARHASFVGRDQERELFLAALAGSDPPFSVMYVFGPGGVGKTSLLGEFAYACQERGIPVAHLDARHFEPSPEAFMTALRVSMRLVPDGSPMEFMASCPTPYVIFVDTYELLAPLDTWLLDTFLPQLPGNVLTVVAGRDPPSMAWRADPGWQALVSVVPLRNLTLEAARELLSKRHVPLDQHAPVLEFTHGHPLALSLVAEVLAQRPGSRFHPVARPDVVRALLEQFVHQVPGPAHRRALETCAVVSLTTESLLAEVLGIPDAHELFEWLCGLSFIEMGPQGIFPHDVAREALNADLRWRDPDWYAELHRRARHLYLRRFQEARGLEQQRVLFDYIFLHRDNPVVKPFFEWQESGSARPEVAHTGDRAAILGMVKAHEGFESERLATFWLDNPLFTAVVFRDARDEAAGFFGMVSMSAEPMAEMEADPAVMSAWRYLQQRAPLRQGETATLFRFWMARDTYQAVSAIQSVIFVSVVRHYLTTPGLAFTIFPCADPDFWMPVFTYADLERIPEADFQVGDRSYGAYGHDWRVRPPLAWLELLGERETADTLAMDTQPQAASALLVLSQPDFEGAVRQALRSFTRTDALASSPLINSRLIVEMVGANAPASERVAALQESIMSAAQPLLRSPRDSRLYHALRLTYFEPAPSQEQAASMLDVPFSTFRRHLREGVHRVTETLWQREVSGHSR